MGVGCGIGKGKAVGAVGMCGTGWMMKKYEKC